MKYMSVLASSIKYYKETQTCMLLYVLFNYRYPT